MYRRAPAIAFYAVADTLIALDTHTGIRSAMPPELAALLCLLGNEWSAEDLAGRWSDWGDVSALRAILDALVLGGFVERSDRPAVRRDGEWKTESAIFHFATRDPQYASDPLEQFGRLRRKAARVAPPAPVKHVAGVQTPLAAPQSLPGLTEPLRARRTWRQFSKDPLAASDLATLLHLTFGVQLWGHGASGPIVLKTSPSGGARHPIEASVIALNVAGLRRGVYHYAAADHALVDLNQRITRRRLIELLANQHYFGDAAVVIVMSAVFARSTWKYDHSRVYRAVLAEAGHLGQTFCVVATALQLAPFCTMAFRDSPLDELLGIDGTTEASMYVVGVGTRPAGTVAYPGRARPSRP